MDAEISNKKIKFNVGRFKSSEVMFESSPIAKYVCIISLFMGSAESAMLDVAQNAELQRGLQILLKLK